MIRVENCTRHKDSVVGKNDVRAKIEDEIRDKIRSVRYL